MESVKGASDIFSPVSGTIVEANKDLLKSPSLINKDPFLRGALIYRERSVYSEI